MVKLFDINKTEHQAHLAIEEASDGILNKELELVFYCKISDVGIFKELKFEDHEQWSFTFKSFNNLDVSTRVRKTTIDKVSQYVHTTKVFGSNQDKLIADELSIQTSEPGFNQFKMFCENGMIKRRFLLPARVNDKDYNFEIDVYFNSDNTYNQWCRIEVELDPEDTLNINWGNIIPKAFTDIIPGTTTNEEQKQFISKLFSEVFLTTNKHVK